MDQANLKLLAQYVLIIEKELAAGNATEHTHRPALKSLIESLVSGVSATNEPKHIECGAPDFVIRKGPVTIGYIEAKDVGKSLDEIEKTDQMKRYRDSLTNLILTDYLEFRWYIDGERRFTARLGTPTKDGKIKRDKDGILAVAELLGNFLTHSAEKVGTPKDLALRMARLAHMIRELIVAAFEKEPESGNLHAQLTAFRDNLIPDLSVEYFADMYAQTIAYGLFAARCAAPDNKAFTRQNAAYLLPKTNPFLRKLFNTIAGPDLDDRVAWLVDDLAHVLAQADMEAVLKNFGKHSGKEDPVVHFYETFLKAYDPKVREMRGVYYTPEPVVSYIVRSIDHLLKTRFNKPMGLADDKTLILDPAVGTATFLYMVINEIHQATIGKGQQGTWNNYVAEKLLPRIFGFELLMAPYAVAHLKLGLLLHETGYEFKSDQRLGIYLTNTLEEAIKRAETLFARWITEEANAAARVKKDEPIMVVLGNPPYSVSSANKGEYIEKLMERYKATVRGERNIQPLSDDYIKFIRFAHDRIERTGYGIIGMITNHTYLSGLVHRGMREQLVKSFSTIYTLDLHGSSLIGEKTPNGSKDENVFDIMQGVAIALFIKEPDNHGLSKVYHTDVWGTREEKYKLLLESDVASSAWCELHPSAPYFFFVPKEFSLETEYNQYFHLPQVFLTFSTGVGTGKDETFVQFDQNQAVQVASELSDPSISEDVIGEKYGIQDTSGWNFTLRRGSLIKTGFQPTDIIKYHYRPFDMRFVFYNPIIRRDQRNSMKHLLKENIALLTCQQQSMTGFHHLLCTRWLVDESVISNRTRERAVVLPLYLYSADGEMQLDGGHRRPNLNPEFVKGISEKLGLKFIEDGKGNLEQTFGPEDIFNYAYAIFHSPTYRTRYAEFLKIDFPRLPLTSDKELFKALAEKGAELVSVHLMESSALNNLITSYPISGPNTVDKVSYDYKNRQVHINKTQYFEGVPPEVWDFHIGGYQVAQKWLKDRKGRTLTYDELTHYQKVVVALKETIRLMAEINSAIPRWPVE